MKKVTCSCGRPAEWISSLTGKPECWELIYIDKSDYIWQAKYRKSKQARHKEKNNDSEKDRQPII